MLIKLVFHVQLSVKIIINEDPHYRAKIITMCKGTKQNKHNILQGCKPERNPSTRSRARYKALSLKSHFS